MIARLDNFKEEVATQKGDQFWLCIDKDHWADSGHIDNLVQVLQHCRRKGYHVAISNPCFELWLLLHFEEAHPPVGCKCGEIASRLSAVVGGYDKTACDRLPIDAEMVRAAVAPAGASSTSICRSSRLRRFTRVYQTLRFCRRGTRSILSRTWQLPIAPRLE